MKAEQRVNAIEERLQQALAPGHLVVIDDSHLHRGHVGAQSGAGHFTVEISADLFAGKSLIACHQLVYQALDDMLPIDIHALSIKVKPQK
jgi:BolA protein